MDFEKLKLKNKSERQRLGLIRRYSNVAHELPQGAQETLASKMGTVTVSARDSFEIYLLGIGAVKPKDDYFLFCQKFAEIFDRKASVTLRKIKSNREKKGDFYLSNDYFGQEFNSLFVKELPAKKNMKCVFFGFEKAFGGTWNKTLKTIIGFFRILCRVGIQGLIRTKLTLGILPRAKEVKWK